MWILQNLRGPRGPGSNIEVEHVRIKQKEVGNGKGDQKSSQSLFILMKFG